MGQKSGISEGRADYKVSGGKLIRVKVRYNGGVIESVNFYGDFFLHPEEAIEELENLISGKSIEEVEPLILTFLSDTELIGAEPEDFVHALRIAIKGDDI